MANVRTTRFSGADWADQLHPIILVGVGGIGSWLALNLARIGHELYLIDPDTVDETNVTGGQMYQQTQVGTTKVAAVHQLCRAFGAVTQITALPQLYTADLGATDIMITGLDNMKARKEVYEAWKAHVCGKETMEERAKCFFMDGRLTLEMYEVLTLQGHKADQLERYERDFLFDDAETVELDCTTKQSTFGAMGIACRMTATLCNWLTNQKLDMEFREVPMYQRDFFPIFEYRKVEAGGANEAAVQLGAAIDAALTEGTLPATPEVAQVVEAVRQAGPPSESVQRIKSLFV